MLEPKPLPRQQSSVESYWGLAHRGVIMHSESQWRYRAYRKGLRLVKHKRDSPAYQRYGPYALVDQATNKVATTGLNAQALKRELFQDAGSRSPASLGPRGRSGAVRRRRPGGGDHRQRPRPT